jgi:hypothetical protein
LAKSIGRKAVGATFSQTTISDKVTICYLLLLSRVGNLELMRRKKTHKRP